MNISVQNKLDFATKAFKDSQFVYAAEICKNILELYPDCIEARYLLQSVSKSLYKSKSFIGKLFSHTLSLIFLLLGFIVCKWNKLKMFQQAVFFHPKGKIPLILLAQAGLDEGYLDLVLLVYKELYEIFPENNSIGIALGELFLCLGNYDKALKIGRQIVGKDPSNIEAMNLIEQAIFAQIQLNSV